MLGNTHWSDYIILILLFCSVGCLSIIQIRKTMKHGRLKSLVQELDDFDKRLLKISGIFFLVFALLLGIRLSI